MSKVDAQLLEYMAQSITAIRSDETLRLTFLSILKANPAAQQIRVSQLTQRLVVDGAPREVLAFVKFLANDQVAAAVIHALET